MVGQRQINLRLMNCYDPQSLIIPGRPSTCDALYYSLYTKQPSPYLYYAQCTHFFDPATWTSPPRSCSDTTTGSFYSYIFYYFRAVVTETPLVLASSIAKWGDLTA